MNRQWKKSVGLVRILMEDDFVALQSPTGQRADEWDETGSPKGFRQAAGVTCSTQQDQSRRGLSKLEKLCPPKR